MEYTNEEEEAIDNLNEGYLYAIRKDNIDMLVIPKEIKIVLNLIKKQNKKIKVLNNIILEDLPTNQKQIKTFCGIPIEKASAIINLYRNTNIHLTYKEFNNYILKDDIREKIKELEKRIEEENSLLELNQIYKEDYKSRVKYLNYAINIYKDLLKEEKTNDNKTIKRNE